MSIHEQSLPSKKFNSPIIVGILGLLLLALLIASSPLTLCYDEPYHLAVAHRVIESTWSEALVDPKSQSAAGPLFAAVHVVLQPLTKLDAPGVRWVNYSLLLLTIVVLASSVTLTGQLQWRPGLSLLSVPFLWPCVGMALTELPALLAFSIYIYCFLRLLEALGDNPVQVKPVFYVWSVAAGVALGASILGRQTYLIVVPSVLVLAFLKPRFWQLGVITIGTALLVCVWPFLLWKGLVPPSQQHTNSGLRLQNLMLSLTYVTAATIIIRPRWINFRNIPFVAVALLVGFVFTWLSRDYNNPPAKSLLMRLFGEKFSLLLGFIVGAALGSLSILWCIETVKRGWRERSDLGRLFLYATLLALIVAPLKVSHLFSSRYVVGALGVLVLVLFDNKTERFENSRLCLGILLGSFMLYTYY